MLAAELTFADVRIDLLSHRVTRAGRVIALTSKELRFTLNLCAVAPAIVSKYDIHIDVIGRAYQSETNIIEVLCAHTREKFGEPLRAPELILTAPFGYVIPHPVELHSSLRGNR